MSISPEMLPIGLILRGLRNQRRQLATPQINDLIGCARTNNRGAHAARVARI